MCSTSSKAASSASGLTVFKSPSSMPMKSPWWMTLPLSWVSRTAKVTEPEITSWKASVMLLTLVFALYHINRYLSSM